MYHENQMWSKVEGTMVHQSHYTCSENNILLLSSCVSVKDISPLVYKCYLNISINATYLIEKFFAVGRLVKIGDPITRRLCDY